MDSPPWEIRRRGVRQRPQRGFRDGGDLTIELLKKLDLEVAEYKICFHYKDPIEKRMVARMMLLGFWNFDGGISARLFLAEVEES